MSKKLNSTVTVDLRVLRSNLKVLRKKVDTSAEIMAVVKADAYGHGAVPVARALQPFVNSFAVNDINEGIELRESGIVAPILVFCVPEKELVPLYPEHNLTATVSAAMHFNILKQDTAYQLNFDTGMGRLGFLPEQAAKVSGIVEQKKDLICTGIYSHFATADMLDSGKVNEQYELFQQVRKSFPDNLPAHICNTGGTSFYKFNQFQSVRLGIGLYGYEPGEERIEELKPVLTWSTHLVETKKKKAGDTISYGASWKMPHDGYIGIIPLGYDDGLRRNLSGQLKVEIHEKLYEVVGRITMNYTMIFLGEQYYPPGTEVNLLNRQELTARDWAQKLDTIPYEILTGISPRIPRTYQDG